METTNVSQTNEMPIENGNKQRIRNKLIIAGSGIILLAGAIGFIYTRSPQFTAVSPAATPTVSDLQTPAAESQALIDSPMPAERRSFPVAGISLEIPQGWTTTEGGSPVEKIVRVTNGTWTINFFRDPLFTGGGIGFMFPGVLGPVDGVEEKTPMIVAGTTVTKVSLSYPARIFGERMGNPSINLENIYGGAVFTSQTGEAIEYPAIMDLNGTKWLVNYEYSYLNQQDNSTQAISVDDPQYREAVAVMDDIVQSMQLEY